MNCDDFVEIDIVKLTIIPKNEIAINQHFNKRHMTEKEIEQIESLAIMEVSIKLGRPVIELSNQFKAEYQRFGEEKQQPTDPHHWQYIVRMEYLETIAEFVNNCLKNGLPKELIFIDRNGSKIDLVGNRNLTENELINIFLDNKSKTDE